MKHSLTIRSIVTRGCVFLLLGAIINVAMAIGVSFLDERSERETFETVERWKAKPSTSEELANWARWARNDWPAAPESSAHQTTFGMRFGIMIATVNDFDPSDLTTDQWIAKSKEQNTFVVRSLACGWPLACLKIDEAEEDYGFPPMWKIRYGGSKVGAYTIPCSVLWPGFAINTIFYAAILWVLFTALGTLRRRRRIRRGLCPVCAYPVGTSDVCTECGKPVTVRSVESAST